MTISIQVPCDGVLVIIFFETMYDKTVTISIQVPCDGVLVIIFFETMYDKTVIKFGFCDILNLIIKVSVRVITLGLQLGW